MRKINTSLLKVLLAIGFFCIISGLIFTAYFTAGVGYNIPVIPIITIILGAIVFYISLAVFNHALLFFIGLFLFSMSGVMIFSRISPALFGQIWPIALILCSISLVLTSLFKHHRIRGVYGFPALFIGLLGVYFLLFSLGLIKISLAQFAAKWFPLFFILLGVVLVVIFLCQQNSDEKFPYEKDDLAGSTDDNDPLMGDDAE